MLDIDARVGCERERVGALTASTSGFWFTYAYASPAMLVGRTVHATTSQ